MSEIEAQYSRILLPMLDAKMDRLYRETLSINQVTEPEKFSAYIGKLRRTTHQWANTTMALIHYNYFLSEVDILLEEAKPTLK